MSRIRVNCDNCKSPFLAREADRRRGWARFCSKSCKAKEQERRTGQHYAREFGGAPVFNRRGEYEGFIPTPFDNTEHQDK